MDDAGSDKRKFLRTIKQLRTINYAFSGSRRLLKNHIIGKMKRHTETPYTFLDIGSGGCDIGLWMVRYCRNRGIRINVTCLDIDPRVLPYMEKKTRGKQDIEIIMKSAFSIETLNNYDFIFSNHFLHHFSDESIVQLLDLINEKADIGFLMNDLIRSKSSYILYSIFSAFFLRNSFAGYDGRLSIKKGLTLQEAEDIIKKTRSSNHFRCFATFPGRICITSAP
jgi:2-polyprenyl-3-methyl-5-hydroxy-6-metoxy-1,4-benzoquinol methylase